MKWYSEVIISDDKKKADYKLSVEAACTEGKRQGDKIECAHPYPVNDYFDEKGYFHIRKANDELIEDFIERLLKAMQKSA